MTRELTAATEHAGVRLDAFLSADGALTRSQAARLIAPLLGEGLQVGLYPLRNVLPDLGQ